MPTIFTARRDEDGYWYALVLTDNSHHPTEMRGFEDLPDLKQQVCEQYQGSELMSSRKFDAEIESRHIHSPEMIAMLQLYGERLGEDLSSHVVYGAPLRPMNATWARIDKAVFMQSDKRQSGYHTYIAVPSRLRSDIVASYEIVFVSKPLA